MLFPAIGHAAGRWAVIGRIPISSICVARLPGFRPLLRWPSGPGIKSAVREPQTGLVVTNER